MRKFGTRFDAEPSPETILNGLPRGDYDAFYMDKNKSGFAERRVRPVPEAGVHPRILCGPDEREDIRRRSEETETGRLLAANLRKQVRATILGDATWEASVYRALQRGEITLAEALLAAPEHSIPPGHYQPPILYPLVMEAFDCWLRGDSERGQSAAAAITGYAAMLEPKVRGYRQGSFPGHAARWGSWHALGSYELFGFQHLGYAYDFAHGFMTEDQRAAVRRVISLITAGAISQGMELPPSWRNWNWMNCGNCFVLLSLAIEGEDGYDERVYKRGVEVMEDYLTYGISARGSSTEAVGYTGFGWVWGVPAMMAMAKRGERLFRHKHLAAYPIWLLHTMQPYGGEWISHGDGGDGGPGPHLLQMLKFHYPEDPVIDELWTQGIREKGKDHRSERMHIIEALIMAEDGGGVAGAGETAEQPLSFFDPERGSLIARNSWTPDAVMLSFECRPDTLTPSHEHGDKGNFSLSALGVKWVGETFRSVETKYHSCVLIDGKGQGYFPAPGKWVELKEFGATDEIADRSGIDASTMTHIASNSDSSSLTDSQETDGSNLQKPNCLSFQVSDGPLQESSHARTSLSAKFGVCDAKYAYDWFWPKTIAASSPSDDARFRHERWASFREEAAKFERLYGDLAIERDPTPSVVAHFSEQTDRDPRYWDEDGWPVRVPHNPVRYAYRTAGLVRGHRPYALIVDDIRKDDEERLYEWTMMLSMEIDLHDIRGGSVHLFSRGKSGYEGPLQGDPMLLVHVLEAAAPELARDYDKQPAIRVETFEKRDTFNDTHAFYKQGGGRSYGVDRRLIVPSRSAEPRFKVLLLPYRYGEELPEIGYDPASQEASLHWSSAGVVESLRFGQLPNGRTVVEPFLGPA